MGSKISNVAGSSVGAIGGVMTLVGLLLAPVTAGGSLALTYGGLGLGATSGVASAVTTVTEKRVNAVQQNKASKDLERFMQYVDRIQRCLDKVINQRAEKLGQDHWDSAKGAVQAVCAVGGVGAIVRKIYKVKIFRNSRTSSKGNLGHDQGGCWYWVECLFHWYGHLHHL